MATNNGRITSPAVGTDRRRFSVLDWWRGPTAGIQGAIEVIGAAGLLQMCHLGRLSGTLEATHEARTIRMTFESGRLATAASEAGQGREAVIDFLAWAEGRFAFQPGATAEGGPISETTEFLILEACRILDEKAAAARIDD